MVVDQLCETIAFLILQFVMYRQQEISSGDTRPYILKTTDYGKTWMMITNGLKENDYNRCVREDPIIAAFYMQVWKWA